MDTTLTSSTYQEQFNQFTPSVFKNELFGNLNVLKDTSGKLWFIGKEVAEGLGYKDYKDALNSHVPPQFKSSINFKEVEGVIYPPNLLGGSPIRTIISEEGLYALIIKSNLNNPYVNEFKNWVYSIISQMRQYGIAVSDEMKIVMDIDPYQVHQIAQQRLNENQELQERLHITTEQLEDTSDRLRERRAFINRQERDLDRLREENRELRKLLENHTKETLEYLENH